MADATIFNNDYLQISKIDENEYILSFQNDEFYKLQETSYHLDSFIKDTKKEDDVIKHTIIAESVQTLTQMLSRKHNRLSYGESLQLLLSIGNQLTMLETEQKRVFNSLDMKNIIVLNDELFIYVSNVNLFNIDDSNMITIDYPVEKTKFDSPTQDSQERIPFSIHKNSWLFSLGAIVCFSLTGNEYSHTIKKKTTYIQLLRQIELLPLYYTVLRCVEDEPEKRVFLHI